MHDFMWVLVITLFKVYRLPHAMPLGSVHLEFQECLSDLLMDGIWKVASEAPWMTSVCVCWVSGVIVLNIHIKTSALLLAAWLLEIYERLKRPKFEK